MRCVELTLRVIFISVGLSCEAAKVSVFRISDAVLEAWGWLIEVRNVPITVGLKCVLASSREVSE